VRKLRCLLLSALLWAGLLPSTATGVSEIRLPLGAYGTGAVITAPVRSIKELREEGITLQKLDYSCGSAALSTLFTAYLDQPFSEQEIIDFIVRNGDMKKITVRNGFSLLDLKRFAESHGVKATGYALDFESLLELQCPVLVPLYRKEADMRHFVIFRGADAERVFLADPAMGRRTIYRSEFEAQWTPRVGMVFSRPDSPPPADHGLALGGSDGAYLSNETLHLVIRQSVVRYIHQANEFR